MQVMERPPFAISPAAPNPVSADPLATDFGMPYLRNPSPLIAGGQPGQASAAALSWNSWRQGDRRIRQESMRLAWFRVFRDGPSTFIITVGSGGTFGFARWSEVDATSRSDDFPGGEIAFNATLAEEVRLWYRVEWSPAIAYGDSRYTINFQLDNYRSYSDAGQGYGRSTPTPGRENSAGTISYVQRLRAEPAVW
jgi:hypothetical protein